MLAKSLPALLAVTFLSREFRHIHAAPTSTVPAEILGRNAQWDFNYYSGTDCNPDEFLGNFSGNDNECVPRGGKSIQVNNNPICAWYLSTWSGNNCRGSCAVLGPVGGAACFNVDFAGVSVTFGSDGTGDACTGGPEAPPGNNGQFGGFEGCG